MKSHSPRKPRWNSSRIAYYFLAATLPPLMIGILLTFMILKDLLIPRAPEPLSGKAKASIPASPTSFAKPVALIALGAGGVQSTEVLTAAAVLAASGRYEIVTAAERRELIRGTSGVELYPHLTLAEAPAPEILVVPSWIGEPSPSELAALKKLAGDARWVLAPGDGARVLATVGFLAGKQATSHPAGRDLLAQSFPGVRWSWNRPVVPDGKWITSDGVFQAIPAALEVLRSAAGDTVAAEITQRIGWVPETLPLAGGEVRWADWLPLILHGGYAWGRTAVGIVLSPNLDDLDLAIAADPYPRTLSARTVLLAPERRVYRSEAGLLLVPNITLEQAPPLDLLIVPGNEGTLTKAADATRDWIEQQGLARRMQTLPLTVSENLRFVFDHLAETEGAWITAFVARMTRYPWKDGPRLSGRVPHLLLRALFISLSSVTLAWFLERRVQAKYARVR